MLNQTRNTKDKKAAEAEAAAAPVVLETVDSDIEVEQESEAKIEKPKGLAEALNEIAEEGEGEYKDPAKPTMPDDPEEIEIPEDEKALREARKRLKEPIFWRSPENKREELRPFAYTDQQYWATMKETNKGGLLDDALLLVFLLKSDKKNLRKHWRKNQWGAPNKEGTRELVRCPLLDKFEDFKDATFVTPEEAYGIEGSPENPLSIYVEVFLRLTAAKTREVTRDEEAEKKTKRPPFGLTSSINT